MYVYTLLTLKVNTKGGLVAVAESADQIQTLFGYMGLAGYPEPNLAEEFMVADKFPVEETRPRILLYCPPTKL